MGSNENGRKGERGKGGRGIGGSTHPGLAGGGWRGVSGGTHLPFSLQTQPTSGQPPFPEPPGDKQSPTPDIPASGCERTATFIPGSYPASSTVEYRTPLVGYWVMTKGADVSFGADPVRGRALLFTAGARLHKWCEVPLESCVGFEVPFPAASPRSRVAVARVARTFRRTVSRGAAVPLYSPFLRSRFRVVAGPPLTFSLTPLRS